MPHTSIAIQQVSYITQNGNTIIKDISCSLAAMKTGLIGKNGVGKSTLLKLISGELSPSSGSIKINGDVVYCPQDLSFYYEKSLAAIFGVEHKLHALERVLRGDYDERDLVILNDDWQIKERILQELKDFAFENLDLDRKFKTLSGGEQTKFILANAFFQKPGLLIFDEPTNNLDKTARELLYHKIQNWNDGLLVVSHDRCLLNMLDQIIELTPLGLRLYGGNYDAYCAEKSLEQTALHRQYMDAKKKFLLTHQTIQTEKEKHDQKRSQGKQRRRLQKIDKMAANSKKGRSELTQNKLQTLNCRLIKGADTQLQIIKEKIIITENINIELPHTIVPNGKTVLKLDQVCFRYAAHTRMLIDKFDLTIQGPERVALLGANGSGKTTLIKLILGELQPLNGNINVGVQQVNYLDQDTYQLYPDRTVLENFMLFNPEINDSNTRLYLAQFLFKNKDVLKAVRLLSGGEKLRALLACILMSKQPPQLLILDEPTNHMDLASIAAIESCLLNYKGALIVISHDEYFLKHIGITKYINI